MIYTSEYMSPFGKLLLASDDINLLGIWFDNQKYLKRTVTEPTITKESHPILDKAKVWLDCYFSGTRPMIEELPLAPRGSEFQQAVWKILCTISYGEVITYKELASKVAKLQGRESMSAQAIGGAVGHNPISIVIPCHRVIGSNKTLVGYAGGIDRKEKLLNFEKNGIYKRSSSLL